MNYSHKSIITFLFAALSVVYACKSPDVALSNRVTLGAYQSGRLQNDVTVRVDSLLDSRCPQGGTCIWAGNATVKATLSKANDYKHVRLVLGPDPANAMSQKSDSTGVVLSGTTYSVVLRDVMPYPKIGSSGPKQALIQVTQL
jgi:hypothetical protein